MQGCAGSIPGWGTSIPHATQGGKKKKKKNLSSRILLQNLALLLPVTLNPGLTFTEQPPHL